MNAYELAYEYVQHTNRCIFLTGKAGTGKTTFLRRLKQECPKQMAVVAPTGVAAINAEGVTIHSLFQLPPQLFLPTPEARKQLFSEMQMRAQKQRVLRNLELLVIDEVSMVRSDLLDTIDAVLRHIKHQPNHPFGGVQVLVIGDLFQLSPVAREEEWRLLQDYYSGPYFFQAHVFQQLNPIYIELDHVFRQSNMDFVEILNQVRNNTLTSQSLQMLNTRYLPEFKADEQEDHYIVLSTHNHKVDTINKREMDTLPSKAYQYSATIKDTFPESMFPMDEVLTLKLGARVMFTKNDSSAEKRYYNGKLGVVSHITNKTITVTCDGEEPIDVHRETWENIRYASEPGSEVVQPEVIGTFSHYPLRLAWAITIHKAQGLTFDRVVIDAADAFAAGQVYVALSRCRSLEGIVLHTPIPSRALTNAREVLDFTNQQQELDTIRQQLPLAQREYLTILLCALYDFRELINRCYAISHMIGKMNSVQNMSDDYFPDIILLLEELQGVGERFQQQVRQIVYLGDMERLQERLKASISYFAPRLHEVLKTISNCPLRSNDKSDASTIKQALIDVYAAIARTAYLQAQVSMAPTVEGYFKARDSFLLKEPNLTIYTAQRKLRTTGTAFQSMALLHQGYRLSEIAKMREITLKTVIKHIKPFIEDGVIDLSDIFPADRKWLR
jgi:hypothetical protein